MKKLFGLFIAILLLWGIWKYSFAGDHDERVAFPAIPADITVEVNGGELRFYGVAPGTIREFLVRSGFRLSDRDMMFPSSETMIQPGMKILLTPARVVTIVSDGQERKIETTAKTTEEILAQAGVTLDEDDIVKPLREALVPEKSKITVTRVLIKEETKEVVIPFATKTKEDDKLSWRKTVIEQKGVNGIKRTTYRMAYYDGKEVNRHVLSVETAKEPVDQIVTQGTYVKVGKAHTGGASWYAFTGTMAAANPWLPIGSYVKVTNTANGKSVVVKINDRGPFVGGRIIDLDKVAFQKIASLGAGVINVKMEEVVN